MKAKMIIKMLPIGKMKVKDVWVIILRVKYDRLDQGVVGRDSVGGHSLIFFRRKYTVKSHDFIAHMRS